MKKNLALDFVATRLAAYTFDCYKAATEASWPLAVRRRESADLTHAIHRDVMEALGESSQKYCDALDILCRVNGIVGPR